MRGIIKAEILRKGTLKDFCEKNDIRQATLSDYLNGRAEIYSDTLTKIIEALGIDPFAMVMNRNVESIYSVRVNGKNYSVNDRVKVVGSMLIHSFSHTHEIHSLFEDERNVYIFLVKEIDQQFNLVIHGKTK